MNISSAGWYVLSSNSDKTWTNFKTDHGLNSMTVYRYVYELANGVTHGATLTQSDWTQIDTNSNPTLSANKGYWVQITSTGSNPEPEPQPEPEPEPEPVASNYMIRFGAEFTDAIGGGSMNQVIRPVQAKWPAGAESTGGVLAFNESLTWPSALQHYYSITNEVVTSVLFSGATAGPTAVAQGVASGNGVTGTGDWITIAHLEGGTTNTFKQSDMNLDVNGTSYTISNGLGFA